MQVNRPEDAHAAADLAQALTQPLNSLMAMAELLQRQSLGAGAGVQVQAILDMGRRMADLLCDSLDAQAAAAPHAPVPTVLRSLVDDIDAMWRPQAGDGGPRLLISCNASSDLRLMIDPAKFRRLLNALIKDAFEAHAWGVVEVQLTVSMEPGGAILVKGRVEAPGGRIAPSNPAAFDLCRTIVRQMDGVLDRHENPGSGVQTAFAFQAPQAGQDPAPVADEVDEAGPLPPRTHLLIVDDNATNRIVAAALCEMFGCTSETAEDGLEAVEAVKSRHFDLVLMDIKMPNMDGLEATRAIRGLAGPAASIPIVALTANADPDAVASYIAGGMQGVVDKPIKPAQLLSALQRALGGEDEATVAQASAA